MASEANNGSSGRTGGNNHRRGGQPPTTTSNAFTGTDSQMDGHHYDLPNEINCDQFKVTTEKLAVIMTAEMGSYATVLSEAFKTLVLEIPADVKDPVGELSDVKLYNWKSEKKEVGDTKRTFESFRAKVFIKVEGQSTKAMKGKITSHAAYSAANAAKDGFALLKIIEGISIGIEGRHNKVVTSGSTGQIPQDSPRQQFIAGVPL